MPEYDAFGRPVGEDPLAEQGWRSGFGETQSEPVSVSAGAAPDTPAAPPPAAPQQVFAASPPAGGQRSRRRRRGGGSWIAAIIMLAVVGGVGLSAFGTVSENFGDARDALRDVQDGFSVDVPSPPSITRDMPTAAADGPSLLTPKGLRAAKRVMQRDVPGRLANLRVEAARIDLQSVRAGRTRIAQLQRGAEATRIFATTNAPRSEDLIAYDEIDPTAPRRLIRAGAKRLGKSPARINYLVLNKVSDGNLFWFAYWRDGDYALGDRRGRLTRVYRG